MSSSVAAAFKDNPALGIAVGVAIFVGVAAYLWWRFPRS